MKARKKPVIIDFVVWNASTEAIAELVDIGLTPDKSFVKSDGSLAIDTLEGTMTAQIGDYVIRGVKGELYPCKPDIFAETYEVIE